MKFFRIWLLLLILSPAVRPETQVSISTPNPGATIGDRIRINVMAKTSTEIDAFSLDIPKKDFEVISKETLPERTGKNYTVHETRLTISFFSTGNYTIGPFDVKLMKNDRVLETRQTNSLEIHIRSVLEKNDRDIKDLKKPVPLAGNPFYALKYALVVLLALALIGFLIVANRRWKQKKLPKPETFRSPIEELQIRISELKKKKLFEKGKFKLFFIRLADTIKHYLFREYHFNARDLTTLETLDFLKNKDEDPRLIESLDALFATADLVKFAKFVPAPQDYRQTLETIDAIVSIQKTKFTPPRDPGCFN